MKEGDGDERRRGVDEETVVVLVIVWIAMIKLTDNTHNLAKRS